MIVDDKLFIPINVRMSSDLVKAIDDWRRVQPAIISRSEVIRTFVEKGLKTETPQLKQRSA